MKQLVPALMLALVAGCVANDPRYREVTLVDSGNYALSSQSVDAFQAEREVESKARQYCAEQRGDYQEVDENSSYVNGAGGPMHRVTLYFHCRGSERSFASPGSTATTRPTTAEPVIASAPLAIEATVASPGDAAEFAADSLAPIANGASARTKPEVTPASRPETERDPEPPFREVTALSEGLLGITRQSLEPFNSRRAVRTEAERYCGEHQQQAEQVDSNTSYVNGSGNNQAHRITLYFRCHSPMLNSGSKVQPEPPFNNVTALGEGQLGITRQSLEPFGSSRAVQASAESYCGKRQQQVEEIDRQLLYVNKGSNEPSHRTTLYFRCKP